MSDGAGWEHAPRRRGGVLLAAVAALGIAAVAGLLLRSPSEPVPERGPGLQVVPGLEDVPDDGAVVRVRDTRVRITSLDPVTLADRSRPVELAASAGIVVSATSDDGTLVVVGAPDGERAVVAGYDARTLEPVGAVQEVEGPLDRLSVAPDGTSLAWLAAAGGNASGPVIVASLLGGERRTIDLPPRFDLLDLRALGDGRVAVVGGESEPSADVSAQEGCMVLVVDEQDVARVSLPDRIGCAGDALEPGMDRPAVAWDLRREQVHLVPADGSLLSVDLAGGGLREVPIDGGTVTEDHAAVRQAVIDPDGAVLYSTGFLWDVRGGDVDGTALAPVAHRLDGGGVLAVGAPDALGGGRVPAVGRRTFVSIVAQAVPWARSDTPLHLSVHRIGSWEPQARHLVTGAASAVHLSDDEQHVTAVSHDSGTPVLRVLDVGTGEVLAERAGFAPHAQVHLREGIVVELLD